MYPSLDDLWPPIPKGAMYRRWFVKNHQWNAESRSFSRCNVSPEYRYATLVLRRLVKYRYYDEHQQYRLARKIFVKYGHGRNGKVPYACTIKYIDHQPGPASWWKRVPAGIHCHICAQPVVYAVKYSWDRMSVSTREKEPMDPSLHAGRQRSYNRLFPVVYCSDERCRMYRPVVELWLAMRGPEVSLAKRFKVPFYPPHSTAQWTGIPLLDYLTFLSNLKLATAKWHRKMKRVPTPNRASNQRES